jgi:hypothetical protein
LLAKEVVAEFGERARYADEDFGTSEKARRAGVEEYPAVFVDDELVAGPDDFVDWSGGGPGRYVPWREPERHRRFQADLRRAVRRHLGLLEEERAGEADPPPPPPPP